MLQMDVRLPDLSDERFRQIVGIRRLPALAAFLAGVLTFLATLEYRGSLGVVAFFASYAAIPIVITIWLVITRAFRIGKLIQASFIIALAKFLVTIAIHLMQEPIRALLSG